MSKLLRDDFKEDIKRKLAGRAGYICSNPDCLQPTSGPSDSDKEVTNIGVASHLTAASQGGPRYDSSYTPDQRSSIDNGIWLCQKCAKMIDDDPTTFTVEKLNAWKIHSEESAREKVVKGPQPLPTKIDIKVLIHKAVIMGQPIISTEYYFIKVINPLQNNEVEITNIWYESEDFTLDIISLPLPIRLKTSELIETFIPVTEIPNHDKIYQNFWVAISTGEVFNSHENVNVRPIGTVRII
jgi:hypothetical protein